MVRALIKNKEAWVRAISLDPFTGLDPKGYKVRSSAERRPHPRVS